MAPRINLPPLTRSLLLSLISFTLLNAILRPGYTGLTPFLHTTGSGSRYLSIIPQHSWKLPYTFVTASFVEQNVFGLLVSGLTLFYGGRYLERAWGSREYARFVIIVGVLPNVLVWALYMVLYGVSGSGKAMYVSIFPPSLIYISHDHPASNETED
jgi:membrane associated rhomboid family serine protease